LLTGMPDTTKFHDLGREIGGGHLEITIWRPGEPERVVRKR